MKKIKDLTQIVQKVKQAPWRVQRQWIGLILLGLVSASMVTGLYLNITARASIAGRETQILIVKIDANKRMNSNLSTQLAALTSDASMQARATDLGFVPATTEEITYLKVTGYAGDKPVNLSTETSSPSPSMLKPEYFETLFDWFTRQIASGATP